jgi:S-adenosylmethionine hydrolase
MLVHVIADYGSGDLAFAEVLQRIKLHLPDAEPVITPVPSFSTLAAGFCIAQLGLNDAPAGTIIYHNVAPRADDPRRRPGNAGERLAYARLPNGVRIIGVNAGHTFAYVRDEAEELRWAAVPDKGSQFRSRDLFPGAAAAIALGQPEALGEDISLEEIPEVPDSCLAYVDGFGNLKTTIQAGDLGNPAGTVVKVRIGQTEHAAITSDATFSVQAGQLAFAPGSSGWSRRGGATIRWMELFLRGGSAWKVFGEPSVGERVTFR